MASLTVTRTIDAPPEAVFAPLADHARYDRFRGIRRAELLREGDPPPNGAGALRRVTIGPLRFDEEITEFESPSRLGYRIIRVNVPFAHEGGTISLSGRDRTEVVWTTTYRVPTPLIGGIQERIWTLVLRRGFRRLLEDVERIATAERST
jgi:uncharacterized protein YndB with AHSA1/START domain